MAGHYSPYPVSVQLLQKHKFCTLDQFQSFINKYQYSHDWYMGSIHRATVQKNFLSLRIDAPFSETIQFPDTFYVDMDCAKIRTVTNQFFNALFLLDLWEEKKWAGIDLNSISEDYKNAVTNVNFAISKFADYIMTTDLEHLEENGIYSRQSFEKKYKLLWSFNGGN